MSTTGADPLKRAAVTGASGFVGTALVQRLAEAGVIVVGTDRYAPESPLPVESFVVADIGDDEALAGVVAGVDVVFHLGAVASIARAPQGLYQRVNVEGTDRVLSLARAAGVQRVVHMSSSTVYGVPDQVPISEEAPLAPACPYSRSKADAEAVCARYGDDGVEVAIIRPRVVVGPGRAGIFALLFTFLRKGLPILLPGGASNQFQLTAVDDLADACLLAANSDVSVEGARVFNIGSQVNRSLRGDLEELVRHAESDSRLVPVPAWPATTSLSALHSLGMGPMVPEQLKVLTADFVLDTRRAREELGFQPSGPNVRGLLAAWDWWRDNAPPGGVMRWWRARHQNALQDR